MPHGIVAVARSEIEGPTPLRRGPSLVLDLRRFPIGRRNEPEFNAFRQLRDGFDITVVNDLDPRSLIADMTAAFGKSFAAEPLEADRGLWRLRIAHSPADSESHSSDAR